MANDIKIMRKMTLTGGKFIFLLALLIRLWGIGSDLPDVVHWDEPHQLNIAAHFGTGDLNPHDFKYPTLWPYLIAVLIGFFYAMGLLFNLVSSPDQFAAYFFYSPTIFYLSVRVMAALAISAGVGLLYRVGKTAVSPRFALIAGLLAALNPILIKHAGEGTPYGLMLFFLCAAIYFLEKMRTGGSRQNYILSGLMIGFATSCHYTAAVFGVWPIALHFTHPGAQRNDRHLFDALLACAAGFLIGTPFSILDPRTFATSIFGLKQSQSTEIWNDSLYNPTRVVNILKNLLYFMDRYGLGFVLAAIGFITRSRSKKIEYLAWLSPLLVVFPFLALATFGTGIRYVMGSYLILIFLATHGFIWLWEKFRVKALRILLSVVVFLPLVLHLYKTKQAETLPDTRVLAKAWLLENAPADGKLFLTDPYYCPQMNRNLIQIERLLKKTQELNHPRKEYFRILREGYPGGGHEIYYLKRTVQEIMDLPSRVEPAYQAQDWFDLDREGIVDLKNTEIHYAVIDDHARFNERNPQWLQDLKTTYLRAAQFAAVPGQTKGPGIEIYDLTKKNPAATKKS